MYSNPKLFLHIEEIKSLKWTSGSLPTPVSARGSIVKREILPILPTKQYTKNDVKNF